MADVTLTSSVSLPGVCAASVALSVPVQYQMMANARATGTVWVVSATGLPRPVAVGVNPEWPMVRSAAAATAIAALVDVSAAHAVLREMVRYQKTETVRITMNVLLTGVSVGMEIFVVCAFPRLLMVTCAAAMTNVILVNVTVEPAART